jgi:hypothetical protein
MRRTLLFVFAFLGGFALSCQVLPHARTGISGAVHGIAPPAVSAEPPSISLADTIAYLEGGPRRALGTREAGVQHVVDLLQRRHTGLSQREIHAVASTIVDECAAQDLEVGLVMAVIQVESAGYHRAESPVGALGLMQIMPATGRDLAQQHGVTWRGPATLFDPVVNVKLGIAYLRELSDRYDHVPTALAAYNWGPGRIDSRKRRGAEMPRVYVEQVMRAYDKVADAPVTRGAPS